MGIKKLVIKLFNITPEVIYKEKVESHYVYPTDSGDNKDVWKGYTSTTLSAILSGNHDKFGIPRKNTYGFVNCYKFGNSDFYSFDHYVSDVAKVFSYVLNVEFAKKFLEEEQKLIKFCFNSEISEGDLVFDYFNTHPDLNIKFKEKFFSKVSYKKPTLGEKEFLSVGKILDKEMDLRIQSPDLAEEVLSLTKFVKENFTKEEVKFSERNKE